MTDRLSRVVMMLVALASAEVVAAQTGVQVTRDGARTLISKDVGGERWAITRNEDGSVTGNVFRADAGEPQFVWCSDEGSAGGRVTLECFGADRCAAAPCLPTAWTTIARVELPETFFQPPADASSAGVLSEPDLASTLAERASALQLSPDQLRTLINKDVAGDRWAITRHAADRTVTGNVYSSSGPPRFVWCAEVGSDQADVSLDCFGAERCDAEPCGGEQWAFIARVRLPLAFFAPPTGIAPSCGNDRIDPGEECDGIDLDGNDCSEAYGGVSQCSGTLACTSDCKFDGSQCACPCLGDTDCFFPTSIGLSGFLGADCTDFFCAPTDASCRTSYACKLGGLCSGGMCRTSTVPALSLCVGVAAPLAQSEPRCPYCEDFDCAALGAP